MEIVIYNPYAKSKEVNPITWTTHPTITKKLVLLYIIFKKSNLLDQYADVASKYLNLIDLKIKSKPDADMHVEVCRFMLWHGLQVDKSAHDYNPYDHPKAKMAERKPIRRGVRNKKLYKFIGKPSNQGFNRMVNNRKGNLF